MIYDAFQWKEIEVGKEIVIPQGRLILRLSQPGAVYITQQGYEGLAGYGADHDYQVTGYATYRVEAEKARAFVKQPDVVTYESTGNIFTNADRMPTESGSMLEVTRAMRLFRFEQQQTLREMRLAAKELNEARAASGEEPQKEPQKEPEKQITAENQAELDPDKKAPEQKTPDEEKK